jgi:hypothetical protein
MHDLIYCCAEAFGLGLTGKEWGSRLQDEMLGA